MNELQQADEAKAKAEKAEAERKKAAGTESNSDEKPLDMETQRMLDIAPRITAVITDMWNASSLRQGWELVVTAIEKKYSVHLGALSRDVY